MLLVRWVRLLLLLPPLRAWPPHRCQVRQGKEARKGADRASSPRGLACAAPIHVACPLRLFQRPLGRGGLPLTVRISLPVRHATMPKGRKADRVWDMGDTKQIQLPKVNNPD